MFICIWLKKTKKWFFLFNLFCKACFTCFSRCYQCVRTFLSIQYVLLCIACQKRLRVIRFLNPYSQYPVDVFVHTNIPHYQTKCTAIMNTIPKIKDDAYLVLQQCVSLISPWSIYTNNVGISLLCSTFNVSQIKTCTVLAFPCFMMELCLCWLV